MKRLLKSKRGVAIELALAMMVIVTAFSLMLTVTAFSSKKHVKDRFDDFKLNIVAEEMGEDFVSWVRGGMEGAFSPVQSNSDYDYDHRSTNNKRTQTLIVYKMAEQEEGNVPMRDQKLLTVELTLPDTIDLTEENYSKFKITKWSQND